MFSRHVARFLLEMQSAVPLCKEWKGTCDDELELVIDSIEKYIMKALHKDVFATLPDDRHHDAALRARISSLSFVTAANLDIPEAAFQETVAQVGCMSDVLLLLPPPPPLLLLLLPCS